MNSPILVSACLLGQPVRYDGQGRQEIHPALLRWQEQGRLVVICPECAGGLPTPRPPAEIVAPGRVETEAGRDVTEAFMRGAEAALALARRHGVEVAILKARSPSCGSRQIYDGSFSGRLVDGMGMTARLLAEAGVAVFDEEQIEEAIRAVEAGV